MTPEEKNKVEKIQQLEQHEELILPISNHWVLTIKPIMSLIIGWLIFFGLFALAGSTKENSPIASSIILIIGYLTILIIHHGFFIAILQWLISNHYITNKKIISFEFFPFMTNDVSYITIEEIHEIEVHQKGFFPNVLNYGTLHINLAATPEVTRLPYIPLPSNKVSLVEAIRDNRLNDEIDIESQQKMFKDKYKYMTRKKW